MALAPPEQKRMPIDPPGLLWRLWHAFKGTNSKTLTVPPVDLQRRWIIVSGANNGIGLEAAKCFARWGAHIILACREPPAWETHPAEAVQECKASAAAAGHTPKIEWWELDLADLSSVESFAQRWLDTGRVLDILCNNAGIGPPPSPQPILTGDGFELVHQVNFLSHVLLTLRLLPSLSRASHPRIVCTTSCHHFLSHFDVDHCNGGEGMKGNIYGNNKLYFQMWVQEFQLRLLRDERYNHITINGVNPGYVNSGIWDNVAIQESWLESFLKFLAAHFAITPQQGSLAIVNAATNPVFGSLHHQPHAGDTTQKMGGGLYINRIWPSTPMPYCTDATSRLEVWKKVAGELGLEEKGLLLDSHE